MSRKYQNIKQYEKEIFELKEQGLTYAQIGEHFGIERIYIKKFYLEAIKMINEEKVIISKDINIGATIAYKDKKKKGH